MKDFSYIALGLAAGMAVPVMAALNANLSGKMGSAFAAAAVLSAVAFVTLVIACWLNGTFAAGLRWPAPTPGYAAGLLFVVYIASITWLAPRIGVGNAVFLVLMGQLVTSALIDHFALFGAPRVALTSRRLLGLVVMAVGLMLARRPI